MAVEEGIEPPTVFKPHLYSKQAPYQLEYSTIHQSYRCASMVVGYERYPRLSLSPNYSFKMAVSEGTNPSAFPVTGECSVIEL